MIKSRLPPADISLTIPGLGPCTNNPDRTLHLNSQQPVTVLVHGCRGSTGNFPRTGRGSWHFMASRVRVSITMTATA